jgi:hypothetical protein
MTTLKCVSDPLATECIELSLMTSRCTGVSELSSLRVMASARVTLVS